MRNTIGILAAAALAVAWSLATANTITQATTSFNLPAQPLAESLRAIAGQTNSNILFDRSLVQGFTAKPLKADLNLDQALKHLLAGTGLTYRNSDDKTVMIVPVTTKTTQNPSPGTGEGGTLREGEGSSGVPGNFGGPNDPCSGSSNPSPGTGEGGTAQRGMRSDPCVGPQKKSFWTRLASAEDQNAKNEEVSSDTSEEKSSGIPEILVKGSRILNMDIPRTRDDVLPFVVLDRQRIERSGATNIEDFLKRRLTMNTQQGTYSQGSDLRGNRSQINLRGLGRNQTLILIDGRRTSASVIGSNELEQQDLNGIPLNAVERIEVLPTSASGIYGGEATGGVINIIMRRDYQGAEVKVGWDSTFDTDDRKRKVELSTGFNLEGGTTNVMVSASWSDGNVLMQRDREFVEEYRDQAFGNRPALLMPPFIPALGFTTNIRSGSAGSPNLVLDNGAALNSSFTFVPVGYAGVSSDGGAGLVANAGKYNFDLAESSQGGGGRRALLNSPTIESINTAIRRQFGPSVQTFLEVGASNNLGRSVVNSITSSYMLPGAAPNNPFLQDIQVTVPVLGLDHETVVRGTDRRVVGGVIGKLPWGWQGEVDYVWSRTGNQIVFHGQVRADSTSAANIALQSDSSFNPLRDTNVYLLDFLPYLTERIQGPFETTTKDVAMLVGGPVGRLPGGRPGVSMKLEQRDEDFGGGSVGNREGGGTISFFPSRSQSVRSAYAEVRVPLISAKNRLAGVEELELRLSGRRDDYEVRGATNSISSTLTEPVVRVDNKLHSINPTVGMRWKPIEDVVLRASYGTGFLPPNVTQLVPNAALSTISGMLLDPRRGDFPIGADIPQARSGGGNPDLEPEESESWSAGVILTPRWAPGLRLSVDWTRIEKVGEIRSHPQASQGLINDEALFPGRIVRGTPTVAEAAMGWAGPITFIDGSLINIALAKVEAYDVQLDYSREAGRWGTFEFFAMATCQPDYQTQTKEGQPIVDNVGFSGGVLEYNGNAGVTWNRGSWTLGWLTNYFDSYLVYSAIASATTIANSTLTQGSTRVPHQIYHDAFATYRFDRGTADSGSGLRMLGSRLLDRTELNLGARNVFNTKPPRDLQSYSTYGDPRLASYYINVRRSL